MSPKHKTAARLQAADPTLPTATITLDGKQYRLCFDLGALAEAEHAINRDLDYAHQIDILSAMPAMNGYNSRVMFAVALRRFHPEIDYETAKAIPDLPALYVARQAIAKLWIAAMPESEEGENPHEASETESPAVAG